MIDSILLTNTVQLLKKKHLTLATAESCSGGLLAHSFTNISGSSDYFDRGVVTYSNQAKKDLLHVKQITLERYGAVSEQTAREMAEGIQSLSKVDIGISTTGIAGPDGGTQEKPVGLVFIGLVFNDTSTVKRYIFSGTRLENKDATVNAALTLLQAVLQH